MVVRSVAAIKSVLNRVKRALFNVYIALNMLTCSIIFAPWAYPRETISGFLGRKVFERSIVALRVARIIDWFYWTEEAHCGHTAITEGNAREELYPGEFNPPSLEADDEDQAGA